MRPVDVIIKKRDHKDLSKEEIDFFIKGITNGEIPDYQIAAWVMAVMLNGMNERETTDLTISMAFSGHVLDLSKTVPIAVDKHSTGGVGDKTTLVVEPIVAACGLPVGKMSGRGLGFSGGTIDKMESIPGYRTDLTDEEFIDQLGHIGLVLTGQSKELAPADGKLYALRDVTGTVQSIPLIASSIMSKKIAAGAQAIILDVKVGTGAFMETVDSARELAKQMVSIGKLSGRKVIAIISDMNQPLGNAVGHILEVREAIDTLQNQGPVDFREHCLTIASYMLLLGEKAAHLKEARQMAETVLENGSAWIKFCKLVQAQGGDLSYVQNTDKFKKAPIIETEMARYKGWISNINARIVGETAVGLGAGRNRKGDHIAHEVGIIIHRKVGDYVEPDQPLFTIHASNREDFLLARKNLLSAFSQIDQPCSPLPLFYDVIS